MGMGYPPLSPFPYPVLIKFGKGFVCPCTVLGIIEYIDENRLMSEEIGRHSETIRENHQYLKMAEIFSPFLCDFGCENRNVYSNMMKFYLICFFQ